MKDNENLFLFHLESSFHIQDIPGYINTISKSTYQFIKKRVFKKSKSEIRDSYVRQLQAITEYFDVL